MKKRVLWKMFLLEIVTIGIYRLYYLIKTRSEMMKLNPEVKILSPAFLLVPIAVIIVAVIGLIVSLVSSTADRVHSCANYSSSQVDYYNTYGSTGGCARADDGGGSLAFLGIFYLGLLVAFILFVVWIWSYSQGVEKVTNGKLSFAVTLIVLILVPDGIDLLIIQDQFNKLDSSSAAPPPPPPAKPVAA